MDLLFPSFLHLTILCTSLYFIFLVYNRKISRNPKFPPGKTGWPIIGEMWEFVMAGRRGNPQKFITERMKKYSPEVFQTSIFGDKLAVLCGPSGNKFLFSNENKYVTSWWPRSIKKILHVPVENSSPEQSTMVLRSFLHEFLKPEALQHCIPIIDSMAKEHLHANWSPYKQVEVFPLSKKFTFAVACRFFTRVKDPDRVSRLEKPFTLAANGIVSLPINFPGTAFNRAIKASKIIHEELLVLIQKRKRELLENKDVEAIDLITRILISSNGEGKTINEKEIASNIIGFLIASHDTTSASITFIVNYLALYPHVYRKVLKEQMEIAKSKGAGELLNWEDIHKMKYSWCVACEAMRVSPPAQGAFREAITDFNYAGFTIPKGWKTHWSVHSTHRIPKYFSDPEKFDPSRFEGKGPAPYTFVPFGGGPRMCPGKEFARVEILVFMHNVVTKFKWEKGIADEKTIFTPFPVPEHGLPVRLQPLEY